MAELEGVRLPVPVANSVNDYRQSKRLTFKPDTVKLTRESYAGLIAHQGTCRCALRPFLSGTF